MEKTIFKFIISTFQEVFDFMLPNLSNYQEFSKFLSKQPLIKKGGNIQYDFDIQLDEIIKNKIEDFNITGKIFSEESGFYDFSDKKYRVVFDPFCNSSLASRTFHEAAVGISIFSYDYSFISSAIMDYQTGIVGIVEHDKTNFYQIQTTEQIIFNNPSHQNLENSWVVITLEDQNERKYIEAVEEMLKKSKRIIISSGHIYWLKLATGMIDVYLDPFGGEPLYEMFASTVAQRNGCIVTDLEGNSFNATDNLKIFEKDQSHRYYPVASSNKHLHEEVLNSLK